MSDGKKFFCFVCGVDLIFRAKDEDCVPCECDFVTNIDRMMLEPDSNDDYWGTLVFPNNQALILDTAESIMLFQNEKEVYSLVHGDDT